MSVQRVLPAAISICICSTSVTRKAVILRRPRRGRMWLSIRLRSMASVDCLMGRRMRPISFIIHKSMISRDLDHTLAKSAAFSVNANSNCQGWGREFESLRPLQISPSKYRVVKKRSHGEGIAVSRAVLLQGEAAIAIRSLIRTR